MASNKYRIVEASSAVGQTKRETETGLGDLLSKTRETAQSIFGTGAELTQSLVRDLDTLKEGPTHSTTGIPYAIHGTATLVQQRVATALGNYQDPIKAVLPTSVHTSRTVIVRRKYVVGGQSIITPERAPARTVAVREDQRTVVLTRYGGDLEMNLNLFLRPQEAKEEFEMKLDAQTRMLNETLVGLGYEMIMHEGTQLHDGLMRMHKGTDAQKMEAAERIYVNSVFGCIEKNRYPIQNLMAAAKMAGTFVPAVNGGYNTMILPAGLLEMEKVTKRENMEWYLNGGTDVNRKQVNVALENVYQDPRVPNMRLLIHQPFPSFQSGSAYPSTTGGHLTREIKIGIFYDVPNTNGGISYRYPNHQTHQWVLGDDNTHMTHFTMMTLHTASAIMAISGSNTGELLYAYPSTGISTSQTTEALKMQLRVYMGAVLYDPSRVLVLPDIHIEGFQGAKVHPENADSLKDKNYVDLMDIQPKIAGSSQGTAAAVLNNAGNDAEVVAMRAFVQLSNLDLNRIIVGTSGNWSLDKEYLESSGFPLRFYSGHVQVHSSASPEWKTHKKNQGHLGNLDEPNNPRLHGQQLFSDHP